MGIQESLENNNRVTTETHILYNHLDQHQRKDAYNNPHSTDTAPGYLRLWIFNTAYQAYKRPT